MAILCQVPARFDRLLIDGFNVLGSRPDGWWRDRPAAMERLLGRLERLAAGDSEQDVTVVFDGRPHERVAAAASAVEVRFAGRGRDAADREIARLVRESERPERILVVSSDRRLRAAVKAAGGRCEGASEFLAARLDPAAGE